MEFDDHIYSNLPRNRPSASKPPEKKGGKKRWIYLVICVFLFFSLLTNAVLTYLYCEIKQAPSALEMICANENRAEYWIREKEKTYVFSQDKMNWHSSRQRCHQLGGDLVIIESKEEHEYLAKMVASIGMTNLHWIGLTDAETEGVWVWIDKSPLKKNLTFWAYPPDDWKAHNPQGEDCAVYYKGGWGDVTCLLKARRICELSCT